MRFVHVNSRLTPVAVSFRRTVNCSLNASLRSSRRPRELSLISSFLLAPSIENFSEPSRCARRCAGVLRYAPFGSTTTQPLQAPSFRYASGQATYSVTVVKVAAFGHRFVTNPKPKSPSSQSNDVLGAGPTPITMSLSMPQESVRS